MKVYRVTWPGGTHDFETEKEALDMVKALVPYIFLSGVTLEWIEVHP